MIRAAYPMLYGREATGEEIELGLAFLTSQRVSLLPSETAKAAAEAKKADTTKAVAEGKKAEGAAAAAAKVAGEEGGAEQARKDLLARRVSMKAWTQYARALFSAAEFRFID
jgi:hypothetical protein